MKIEGMEKVNRWFKVRQDRLKNPRHFLQKCATTLGASAAKTWNQQGRPRWAARKDDKTHPILDLTGRLRDSLEMTTATGDAIVKISTSSGKAWLDKGTSVEYAAHHQFGTKNMVARPFMQFQDEDIEDISDAAVNYFFEAHDD